MFPLLSTYQQEKEEREIELKNKAEARACRASQVWLLFWKNEKTLQGFKHRSELVWSALIQGVWERTWVKQEWGWGNQRRGCCKCPRGRREWAQRGCKEEGRQDAYSGGKHETCWQPEAACDGEDSKAQRLRSVFLILRKGEDGNATVWDGDA